MRLGLPQILCLLLAGPSLVSAEKLALITVTQRGLHGVTAWDLHAAGVDVADAPAAELGFTSMGQRIAATVDDADGDGLFNGADRLVFFGQPRRDDEIYRYRYADFNAYILERWPAGEAPPIEARPQWLGPTRALGAETPVSMQRLEHFERDAFWSDTFAHPGSPATDFSYTGNLDKSRRPTRTEVFDLPGLDRGAGAPFSLALLFQGRSSASQARHEGEADHSIQIAVNDFPIGTVNFDGPTQRRAVFDGLSASLLQPQGNRLTLTVASREAVPIDLSFLDWYEVQFPIVPVTISDRGEFALPGPSAGQRFEIRGFTSPKVSLFCLTTEAPISAEVSRDRTRLYSVAFTAPCDDGLYAISTSARLIAPDRIDPFAPEFKLKPASGAEYLVITHPNFHAAADRLASHRRAEGLPSQVVDINDLYAHFSGGVPNPEALRLGLKHVFEQWPEPRLEYVVLMGDASWDWHQLSHPSLTYIPTHYFPSSQLDYCSDARFAMVGEDEVPRFTVGRLPVKTPDEAEAVVDKLIAYDEQITAESGAPEDWRHRIIFAASDNAMYRDFLDQAVSKYIEGNFDLRRAYATDETPLDCTQLLVDTFNDGVAFVSYVGHGGARVWQTGTTLARRASDYEANFNPQRVLQLVNGARLPIVFGITCFTNNFDNPNPLNSIGEELILSRKGGAIISLATSSYSFVQSDLHFSDLLFETLFAKKPERFGDLYLDAVQHPEITQEVRNMFIILGDPASRLPLVPLPGRENSVAARAASEEQLREEIAAEASAESVSTASSATGEAAQEATSPTAE